MGGEVNVWRLAFRACRLAQRCRGERFSVRTSVTVGANASPKHLTSDVSLLTPVPGIVGIVGAVGIVGVPD
jgi:hypothetical protein